MNEDCLLVEAIKAGDVNRFEELVDKYKDNVYNMVFHMTGSSQEEQDLAQEIFLLIYKNISNFNGESALSTWIYRISLNRCLDWQRKQQRRSKFILPILYKNNEELNDPMENLSTQQPGPEEQLLRNEQYQELHNGIKELPEKYQKVIILYHFQQMPYQRIAEILDIPARTVETQLYRGKQRLKEILTKRIGKGVKAYEYV